MKNLNRRFETVSVAEVLVKALEMDDEARRKMIDQDGRGRPKRVLVVDDERVIADTLGIILGNSGYETTVAYDAESALRQCEAVNPELVITDVIMPGMDGVEMAMLVRERHPACKVLLISGQASTTNLLEEARRRGYDFELLAKPIHPTDLLARLATLEFDPALSRQGEHIPAAAF